jgi:hypothetical protein
MSTAAGSEKRREIRLVVRGELSVRLAPQSPWLRVIDFSHGGFLADSPEPIPVDTRLTVQLAARDGTVITVDARCAHCRRRPPDTGSTFAVGFAFVAANSAVDALIDRLTGAITFQ